MAADESPMGFDVGFGITVPPDVTQPLEMAQSVASGLAGQIRDHVTNVAARSAAATDGLAGVLQEHLQEQLTDAARNALQLQAPLQTQIAGQLSSNMELATQLGAVPPMPDSPGIMPPQVQVRTAALQGDLSPALEWFRDSALPYAHFKGLQYGQAVQKIVDALPDDPKIKASFYRAIEAVKTDTQSAGLLGVKSLQASPPLSTTEAALNVATGQPTLSADAASVSGPGQVMAPLDAIGDQIRCEAEAAAALANALAQCGLQYWGDPIAIANCQTEAQRRFLQRPPCGERSPGSPPPGGVGIVPTPNGPRPVIRQGADGKCPAGTHPGLAWNGVDMASCIPDVGPAIGEPGGPGGPGAPPGGPGGAGELPPAGQLPPGGMTPPGGTVPPCVPSGCKDRQGNPQTVGSIGQLVQADYAQSNDVFASAASISEQLGIPITVVAVTDSCPTGFTEFGVNTGSQLSPAVKLCINCPTTDCPTSPPAADKCCPVVVNVNCPPTTPASKSPPGQNENAPAPPPPPPPGANVNKVDVAGCKEFGDVPGIQLPNGIQSVSQLLGVRNADGSINVPFTGLDALTPWGVFANNAIGYLNTLLDQGAKVIDQVLQQTGCAGGQQMALSATAIILNLFNKYVGDALAFVDTPVRQQKNFLCPVDLPSPNEAGQAWLGNTISEETLQCWVRAAGTRFPEFKKVLDAARTKFPLLTIGSLYLRGLLTDADLEERVRELGYTQGTEVAELKELLKLLPPPSDLVRFMVRDAADETLVQKFGMDTDFTEKFAGQIPQWAEAQGLSEEFMKMVWRAHWSIPAVGQLFELLHRSAELDQASDAFTSFDDVTTAMEQQDILPYWIPKLLAASFNKLGRIDLRRGYALGVIDDDQLITKYQVAGYNEADANTLARVTKRQTIAALFRSPIVLQMASGYLADDEFDNLLIQDGATQEMVDLARSRALVLARMKSRKRCADAYRKRYLIGDLSRDDVQALLLGRGISADVAANILDGWSCEKSAQGKAIPTGELSKLYEQGAIDARGLTDRLQRIGYSYDDSVILARRISTTVQQKLSAADAKALRQSEAEALKEQRQAQQAVRQALAQSQRQANRANALRRLSSTRSKRLQESGRSFSTHSGLSLPDSVAIVTSLYQRLLSNSLFTHDEIISTIVTATQDKKITDADTLSASVLSMLNSIAPTVGS